MFGSLNNVLTDIYKVTAVTNESCRVYLNSAGEVNLSLEKGKMVFTFSTISTIILTTYFINFINADGHAHSFQHYHGPVIGDDQEITWKDKHGHHHKDFVAKPHYEFAYGVQDHHTGDYHGQKEHRDGKEVTGEYTVKEPGGNVRTVKYHADKSGFHAHVHNSNGNDHSGGHHHR